METPNYASLKLLLQSVVTQQAWSGNLQVDTVGQLPTSWGYEFILIAVDDFHKYIFAVPLRSAPADAVATTLFRNFHETFLFANYYFVGPGINFAKRS